MKWVKFSRTCKDGWHNFERDRWLTVATVVVLVLALYLVTVIALLGFGIASVVDTAEDRLNISVYFNNDVGEGGIKKIQREVEERNIIEIESMRYVSRDEALSFFKEQSQNNDAMKKTLDSLEDNPFYDSLVITAARADAYEKIDTYMKQTYAEQINYTNYGRNRSTMESAQSFIRFARLGGATLGILFSLVAVLITFNAIRMNIYAHRQEFEVMRLVGASNTYVRMPSVIEGVLYGLFAGVITALLMVVTVFGLNEPAKRVLEDVALAQFYTTHMIGLSLGIILLGILLGALGSFIAVRRYLER